jgi:hypothetical protein
MNLNFNHHETIIKTIVHTFYKSIFKYSRENNLWSRYICNRLIAITWSVNHSQRDIQWSTD